MDQEEEEIKSIYAAFGVAIYYAQCLEHGIVNSLVTIALMPEFSKGLIPLEQWPKMLDDFMNKHFETTLGTMIKALNRSIGVPSELQRMLEESRKTRNWLAHGYFRDRAEHFLSSDGRAKMMAELEESRLLLHQTDALLEQSFESVRLQYGITDTLIEKELANLLKQASNSE